MSATRYRFKGGTYRGDTLIELLILQGLAAPAARGIPVDDIIRAIIDQGFLNEQDAPVKVQ